MRPALPLAILLLGAGAVRAADLELPPTPAEVGVRVEKPAGDGHHYSQGSGIYLGGGLVLTAEHVVKFDPDNREVTVLLDGVRTPGDLVYEGTQKGVDLALIKLGSDVMPAKRIAQAQVPACAANPAPSEHVVVVAKGEVSRSSTIAKPIVREGDKTESTEGKGDWTNILATGYHAGNSGGGVFEPRHRCLLGILSFELGGKLGGVGPAVDFTAFVPATEIAPFLADYAREAAAK